MYWNIIGKSHVVFKVIILKKNITRVTDMFRNNNFSNLKKEIIENISLCATSTFSCFLVSFLAGKLPS